MVALSIMKVEYMTSTIVTKEAIWLQQLCKDMLNQLRFFVKTKVVSL